MESEDGRWSEDGSDGYPHFVIPGQTTIPREVPGVPEMEGQHCDWCGKPATVHREIRRKIRGDKGTMGTGRFMFACGGHADTLRRSIDDLARRSS